MKTNAAAAEEKGHIDASTDWLSMMIGSLPGGLTECIRGPIGTKTGIPDWSVNWKL